MEDLIIQSTKISPEVIFHPNGNLSIEGKIITENAVITFAPIFNWIEGFSGDHIEFTIHLEYINTSAAMQLFSLLNKLDDNTEINSIHINWYYEEDDEEHLETGEMFADRLERSEFKYFEVKEHRGVA